MATPKISMFIIALVWISFFASIAAPFIANLGTNYGNNFDESQINTYNKLEELNEEVEGYKESTLAYKEKSGLQDIIGDIFSQGFKSLKLMVGSLDIFKLMVFDAFNDSAYNIPAMQNLKVAGLLTVLILIIIGVIVKAVTKTDV